MSQESKKKLEEYLKSLLKTHGFKKKALTWRKDAGECIQVLNIQGSQWSDSFYLNLGIYFKALGGESAPNEYDCHIRERLTGITPDLGKTNSLLDFEIQMEEKNRLNEFASEVEQYGIPWLEKCCSIEGAKSYLVKEKKHGLPVRKEVYGYLNISP